MWEQILPFLMSGLFGGSIIGGIVSAYNAKQNKLSRISGDEREARRDMLSDRDAYVKDLRDDMREVREDARAQRLRAEGLEVKIRGLYDHVDVLEHHIWTGQSPPPPTRPEGL